MDFRRLLVQVVHDQHLHHSVYIIHIPRYHVGRQVRSFISFPSTVSLDSKELQIRRRVPSHQLASFSNSPGIESRLGDCVVYVGGSDAAHYTLFNDCASNGWQRLV